MMSSTSPAVLYGLMGVIYLGPISMLDTIPLQTGCGSLRFLRVWSKTPVPWQVLLGIAISCLELEWDLG
jgi:hypothetical protein